MTQITKPHLPIGYWLKQADNLITEQVNRVQAIHDVTRSDWQVINTLYEIGTASKERIFAGIRSFIDAGTLDAILIQLMTRGWIATIEHEENGKVAYQLTEEGRQHHSIILAAQKEVRQRTMQGISEGEYETVMRVLQQIVRNLEFVEEGDTAVSGENHHGN